MFQSNSQVQCNPNQNTKSILIYKINCERIFFPKMLGKLDLCMHKYKTKLLLYTLHKNKVTMGPGKYWGISVNNGIGKNLS